MKLELYIKGQGGNIFAPIVSDEIVWETEKRGSPSKLTFTVIKDDVISFPEGAPVILKVNGVGVFQGFVFQKSRDKEQRIQCVCYDQLRYFKNKHTLQYEGGITATEVIRRLAKDFEVQLGELTNTKYPLPARLEKDKTIFDIILNALDITTGQIKQNFVLYDDFGKLTLQNEQDMYVPVIINEQTAVNFDYTSSIDTDTYNRVYIYHESSDNGTTKRESVKQDHASNISKWGILQYHEKVADDVNLKERAKQVLDMKSRPTRSLDIKNAFGDTRVRAGCHIPIKLYLGDRTTNYNLRCDKVVHKFTANSHFMDLTLSGHYGEFGED